MFSGKTDELLRRTAGGVLVKPHVDDRHDVPEVVSHSGARAPALVVASSAELPARSRARRSSGSTRASSSTAGSRTSCASSRPAAHAWSSPRWIATSAREPFPVIEELRARADRVDLLTADVQPLRRRRDADAAASATAGPSRSTTRSIRVGGAELYEPRCARCWAEEREAVRAGP